jgi:MFS family permease
VSSELRSRLLFGAYVVLAVVGVGIVGFARGRAEEGSLVLLLAGFAIAGRLLTRRRPENRIGWILAWIAVVFAVQGVAEGLAGSATRDDPRIFAELAGWLSEWVWYFWLGLVGVALPLLFPDGKLASRRWLPVAWAGIAGTLLGALGSMIAPGRMDADAEVPLVNPVGISGAEAVSDALLGVAIVLTVIGFVGGAASLVKRLRRSRGAERQQLKWFAFVVAGMATGLVLAGLAVATGEDDGVLLVIGSVGWMSMLFFMGIGIPAATGIAVLRHRLYDIDLVIRRTVVYAALSATLLASYLGLVLLLGLALSPLTEESDLAIAGSTLAVAALFRPLRARIQDAVDRRFYRRRYDTARTVEAFSARLRDQVELAAVEHELRTVAAQTMQPAHLTLWLRRGEAAP